MAVIVLFIAIVIIMSCSALMISVVAAMFLHTPFVTGWHYAWDNPWKLLLFAVIIGPILAINWD